MTKATRRIFTVEGNGLFPFDMLRYDHAWPYTEAADSPALGGDYGTALRRVVLATDEPSAPTRGRWESHTWRVIGVGELRDPAQYPTPPRSV